MIKTILDNLFPEQKRELMYAFDHQIERFIILPDNKYIGVNAQNIKFLEPEEQAGVWSYGHKK